MIFDHHYFYAITSAINAFTSFGLGLFILLQNPRSKLNQLWGWMSFSIALWAFGLVGVFSLDSNHDLALLLDRIGHAGAVFIPLFYLHFIIVFLGNREHQFLLRVCYTFTLFLVLTVPFPLFIKDVVAINGFSYYTEAGPLYACFLALYVFEPLFAIRLLSKTRSISEGRWKHLITHVMLAGIIGFLVGATMFPFCWKIPISPWGGHFIWLYCLFVSWAIFKYQMFDIRVVIRKSIAYSILITLLTAGYFGLIYGIEHLLQTTLGYKSLWVSLGSFAVITLVFQPLKISIQRIVDWVIFRVPQEEIVKRMERLEEEAQQSEKLRAISTLAAGMAHEIKNPLTALRTFAEYVPEKHKDPDFADRLHKVLMLETERIQGIVQDVLDFAKPKMPQRKPVDPEILIYSTTNLLSGELLKRRIECKIDCQHNGTTLRADPDQLRQVLINLIQNAADAMPNGGTLSLATRNINSHLELTVSDTGTGIPKELLPKIFDPFVTTKSDGNGLGLAMVHSIIRAHGGTIRAESRRSADGPVADQPGAGTTFTVSLPL